MKICERQQIEEIFMSFPCNNFVWFEIELLLCGHCFEFGDYFVVSCGHTYPMGDHCNRSVTGLDRFFMRVGSKNIALQ